MAMVANNWEVISGALSGTHQKIGGIGVDLELDSSITRVICVSTLWSGNIASWEIPYR